MNNHSPVTSGLTCEHCSWGLWGESFPSQKVIHPLGNLWGASRSLPGASVTVFMGEVLCHRRKRDISLQTRVLWRHHGHVGKWKWFLICQNMNTWWAPVESAFVFMGYFCSICSLWNSHRKLGLHGIIFPLSCLVPLLWPPQWIATCYAPLSPQTWLWRIDGVILGKSSYQNLVL